MKTLCTLIGLILLFLNGVNSQNIAGKVNWGEEIKDKNRSQLINKVIHQDGKIYVLKNKISPPSPPTIDVFDSQLKSLNNTDIQFDDGAFYADFINLNDQLFLFNLKSRAYLLLFSKTMTRVIMILF